MTTAQRDAIDHTALGWVKPEIDETLRQARIDVEAFADAPDDTSPMQSCREHLHQIHGTLRMLELSTPAMVASEMEQVAGALYDAVTPNRDEALAVLMRGIVQLPDYLERLQGGHREIPVVLLPLINELRTSRGAVGLDEAALPALSVAPSDEELEHARGSLAGRNRQLLDTVSAALKEDLLRVKDALDLYLRGNRSNVQELQPQAEALDRIGDTLGMLGLKSAQTVVDEQRQVVQDIAGGTREISEDALMDVAGALIYIDHSLDAQVARLGSADAAVESDELLAQESRKVLGALARAAVMNFAEVRNAFITFVETNWDHAALESVPRLLTEVVGAMRILEMPDAAGYLDALRVYCQRELLASKLVPDGASLNTLADALVSVEYYLEALHDPRGLRPDLLDKTRASLEQLQYWPIPQGEDAAPAAQAQAVELPVDVASEMPALAPLDDVETSDDTELAASDDASHSSEAQPALEQVAAAATKPLDVGFEAAGEEIDDEIREIFLEEFQEEISNLDTLLPEWRLTPDDMERLRPIRRVFHTLKGSGRLVGAKTLGEFSWHVENMMNRVLDGTRPPSHAVITYVAQVRGVLPALLAALRGETVGGVNIPVMESVAGRLAAGEDILLSEVAAAEAASEPTAVEAVPDVSPAEVHTVAASVDPVLLDILVSEVGGHLETIDAWLAQAHAGDAKASDVLARAIHTLNGAFAMTEVPSVTEFTAPTEAYVKRALAANEAVTTDGIAAIAEVADAVRASTQALQTSPEHVPVFATLATRVATLRDTLPESTIPFVSPEAMEIERAEAERAEAERAEAERAEAERAEAERVEAERADAERAEAERADAERAEAERAEAERAEAERAEAERVEAERVEAERVEAERVDAERAEAERVEAERAEAERVEAERVEAERVEAERADAERAEVERITAARVEAERLEAERAEAARREAERREAERRAAETAASAKAREEAALAALQAIPAAAEDPDLALDTSELDLELVDIFVEEAGDLLDQSDGLLAQLHDQPDDAEAVIEVQRALHTMKGGARMAGMMSIGELAHAMESLLEATSMHRVALDVDGVSALERGYDRLHTMVTRIAARRMVGLPETLINEFNARAEGKAVAPAAAGEVDQAPAATPKKPVELTELSAPIMAGGFDDDDFGAHRAPQEQVRIRADLLDRLVNYAGEVAIYRARLEQQLAAFRGTAQEMERTNIRLRDQLRRLDAETEAQIVARYQRQTEAGTESFDPLELDRFSTLQQLSRGLAESAADLQSLHGSMEDLSRQYETLLTQQSRVSSELQDGLMRTRMLPFDSLAPRLRRVVRQAATETGKAALLKLDGTHGELDRSVLETMTAPLEHMLRNAVAHGLESREARSDAGKPAEGTITIAVRREGSEVVLSISDDGAGLNRDAIRRRGIERGLIQADEVMANSELDRLIMQPGFSTAETVSQLAGRGVGMDVVASEVRQLGGTIDIESQPGKGTTFTLRLPQTLAVTQAVFVKIGDIEYAVPIASVRGVGRISREELAKPDATYRYGGEDYVLHDLGALVGTARAKAEGHLQMPLLLVRAGDVRAAVTVDEVIRSREIVVKEGGPQLTSIPGIFGGTIMGDGRVVMILDVVPLVRRFAAAPEAVAEAASAQVVEQRKVPLVMVVDDSVTMRKVTGRVLERYSFEVSTAKDGIDALEHMAEVIPDLMLLDIEMPRMDGFELATAMKADPRMRNVPIIMITSRTGDKHRQRAMDLGVEKYLGKPYQEVELMRNVYELLKLDYRDSGIAQ